MSDFPVLVTAEAADQLRKLLARKGDENSFIRVGVKGGGCSGFEYLLKVDTREIEGDAVLLLDGLKVVCDPKSSEFLRGATLSLSGNLIGGGFTFDNPNAQRSCGCGTSFTPRKTA